MTRHAAIYTGCWIARDPAENTASHQAMVDALNAEAAADGWRGAKVIHFTSDGRLTTVGIEPGPSPLTLDYLRRLKEAGQETPAEPLRPVQVAEQGGLL